MKLSIVIPAYNEEKYLGNCLKFVFKQIETLPDKDQVEVIVVNNASVDNTEKIARSFANVIVVNELKKGLPWARQAGFKASCGELIANIDADTQLPQNWIEKVLQEFAADNNLVALSGPYIYYDLSMIASVLVAVWYRIGQMTNFINQTILKKGAMLQGGNFILRRNALEKIGGYDTSINFWGEDTDIARRISAIGKVKFTFNLFMPTSARRFKKEGFIFVGWKYLINYIWIIFFKKPFTKEYTELQN
jgi:glycosyltransferase involved in cell wall biosynthesis